MYRVAVEREFIAQHFLIGGDWGAENNLHSHHYRLELELSGGSLDVHNYLVDIVDIESQLDEQVAIYKDKTLNDLTIFTNVNPSLEFFSQVLCQSLNSRIKATNIKRVMVKLWENQIAWASYELER
jgi:6-pyruvoyltetrahydropterin/6-carboxytetrahydropterin synthase